MIEPRTVRAFRIMAVPFAAMTVFVAVLFINALTEQEIRTGLFTYAAFTGAAAVGLWRVKRWGRSLGLVVLLGNAALGMLTLLAVVMRGDGSPLPSGVVLVVSVALAYVLGRADYQLPSDHQA